MKETRGFSALNEKVCSPASFTRRHDGRLVSRVNVGDGRYIYISSQRLLVP